MAGTSIADRRQLACKATRVTLSRSGDRIGRTEPRRVAAVALTMACSLHMKVFCSFRNLNAIL